MMKRWMKAIPLFLASFTGIILGEINDSQVFADRIQLDGDLNFGRHELTQAFRVGGGPINCTEMLRLRVETQVPQPPQVARDQRRKLNTDGVHGGKSDWKLSARLSQKLTHQQTEQKLDDATIRLNLERWSVFGGQADQFVAEHRTIDLTENSQQIYWLNEGEDVPRTENLTFQREIPQDGIQLLLGDRSQLTEGEYKAQVTWETSVEYEEENREEQEDEQVVERIDDPENLTEYIARLRRRRFDDVYVVMRTMEIETRREVGKEIDRVIDRDERVMAKRIRAKCGGEEDLKVYTDAARQRMIRVRMKQIKRHCLEFVAGGNSNQACIDLAKSYARLSGVCNPVTGIRDSSQIPADEITMDSILDSVIAACRAHGVAQVTVDRAFLLCKSRRTCVIGMHIQEWFLRKEMVDEQYRISMIAPPDGLNILIGEFKDFVKSQYLLYPGRTISKERNCVDRLIGNGKLEKDPVFIKLKALSFPVIRDRFPRDRDDMVGIKDSGLNQYKHDAFYPC